MNTNFGKKELRSKKYESEQIRSTVLVFFAFIAFVFFILVLAVLQVV